MIDNQQQEGKDPLVPFLATLTGVALLTITPIDFRLKVGIAAIASIPGSAFALSEWHLYRDRKREILRLGRETQILEETNDQLNHALDARQAQIELDRNAIEQLRAITENEAARIKLETELEVERRLADAAQIEAAIKADIERKKEETDRLCDRLIEDAKIASEARLRFIDSKHGNLKAEIKQARESAYLAIKRSRSKWRELQQLRGQEWQSAIKAEWQQVELGRKQLELDRSTMLQELALERAHVADQVANELADIAKRKATASAEIDELWAQFETEKQAAISMFTQEMIDENDAKINAEIKKVNQELGEKKKELNALIAQTNQELTQKQQELEAYYEAQYQSWLIGHHADVVALQEECDRWKAQYYQAEEELAAAKDIVLPDAPWGCPHKSRARDLQLYFKERGFLCNYVNSALKNGTFTLYFKPWVTGRKITTAINGLLDGMIADWGLLGRPTYGEAREGSWWIEMISAEGSAVAAPNDFMNLNGVAYDDRRIPATDPRLEVPGSFGTLEDELRQRVLGEIGANQRTDEMMSFRPPAKLPKPTEYAISPVELKTAEWYCFWRSAATRRDPQPQANIREVNLLLKLLYGVNVGSSTESRDRVTGESLRQRVHRICKLIKVDIRIKGDLTDPDA